MTARFIDNGGKRSLEILDSSAFVAFVASGRLRRRLQHSVRRHRHAQLEHLAHIGLVVQHHQVRVAALVQVALVADLQGVRRVVGDGPHRLGQRGARPAHQVAHARGQVRGGPASGAPSRVSRSAGRPSRTCRRATQTSAWCLSLGRIFPGWPGTPTHTWMAPRGRRRKSSRSKGCFCRSRAP